MTKKLLLVLLLAMIFSPAFARRDGSHIQISLLTCGPGDEEVWEVFGHTGLRVIDSIAKTDIVYNYGTFDFGPDFELQFMRGKLLYSVSVWEYGIFMQEYITAGRSVQEQVLSLDSQQKEHVFDFLEWNALPSNKYYKYDFFFDNCATRIRDIFPRPDVFGNAFRFGNAVPPDSRITFRDIINRYFYRDHWTRVGVNILLGSRIDRVMTNRDIMFLPDYLRDGIGGSTVDGKAISGPAKLILDGKKPAEAGPDVPFAVMLLVAVLTVAGLSVRRLRLLGRIMTALLLAVTGLLGCLILVMWLGTDHQGCANNYNLLWCLPLNIVIAFFRPKGRGKYALAAMIFLLISVVLHIVKVQGLTLLELSPLFVALLFVYGSIYQSGKSIKPAHA